MTLQNDFSLPQLKDCYELIKMPITNAFAKNADG
jgi:hypothetical protein